MSHPEAVEVGDALPARTFPVTRADLVRYAGASGDFNVIHWNERVAREVGLPDVIAHGMLTMALVGRALSEWAGDPTAVSDFSVRFTRPVVVPDDEVGATLEVGGTVSAVDPEAGTARIDLVASSGGVTVLGRARATVRLPRP
ncbi:MAG TPA: MaoC family dehydratase [Actinomycetes bacterium]|nr:MaoC family dehydratase [Actinomycetes bacterium]